eukprot:1149032-Pelagomonas_calceolata.AAC.2
MGMRGAGRGAEHRVGVEKRITGPAAKTRRPLLSCCLIWYAAYALAPQRARTANAGAACAVMIGCYHLSVRKLDQLQELTLDLLGKMVPCEQKCCRVMIRKAARSAICFGQVEH